MKGHIKMFQSEMIVSIYLHLMGFICKVFLIIIIIIVNFIGEIGMFNGMKQRYKAKSFYIKEILKASS